MPGWLGSSDPAGATAQLSTICGPLSWAVGVSVESCALAAGDGHDQGDEDGEHGKEAAPGGHLRGSFSSSDGTSNAVPGPETRYRAGEVWHFDVAVGTAKILRC